MAIVPVSCLYYQERQARRDVKAALILMLSTVMKSSLIIASAATGILAIPAAVKIPIVSKVGIPIGVFNLLCPNSNQVRNAKGQCVAAPTAPKPTPKPVVCPPHWAPTAPGSRVKCELIVQRPTKPLAPICPDPNTCNPSMSQLRSSHLS
ncbi:MAG: hypothetical protein WAM14_18710 [Candidatus Nitrosopolaris sp.]